jgi:hypothetical protein
MGIYFGFGQQGSSIIQPIAGNFMDRIGIMGVYNVIAPISIGLSALAGISRLTQLPYLQEPQSGVNYKLSTVNCLRPRHCKFHTVIR